MSTSLPVSFSAAVVDAPGTAHAVLSRTLSSPHAGEATVRVTATAVNPIDWKLHEGQYGGFVNFPSVLGSDAAGEVVAVGEGVEPATLAVGDRVFFQGIIGNKDASTFQQYCRMPVELLAKTPASISDDEAAGVSLASIAAAAALYDSSTGYGLAPPWISKTAGAGRAIAIIGGSSSVGQYLIQLARLSGFDRIVTNSSPANAPLLTSLGAHVVLDRSNNSEPNDFVNATSGVPLGLVVDTISDATTQVLAVRISREAVGVNTESPPPLVITTLTPHPDAVALASGINVAQDQTSEPPRSQAPQTAPVRIRDVVALGSLPSLRPLSVPFFAHLGGSKGYLATGDVRPNRPAVVPGGLSNIGNVLEMQRRGVSAVKLIVRPFDD
ncbi:hypothetical protein HK405_008481 [Cladochytrium tenue]|nr:hypothetical protein HK405_008481 [Cladochytrium tenue]